MSEDTNENIDQPVLDGNLRSHNVRLPKEAFKAPGIRILGKAIHAIVYTTDIAIIRNCDADAVFAVYPFTPQQIISKMLIESSSMPVLVGVGGGTTSGSRSAILAKDAEAAGAYGVVLNAPVSNITLEMVSRIIDIPVIVSVVDDDPSVIEARIESGASIVNVTAGKNTAQVVENIRRQFPKLPIIATGGKSPESITETIEAGANSIICTPPSNSELFSPMMERYRNYVDAHNEHPEARPLSKSALAEVGGDIDKLRKRWLLFGDPLDHHDVHNAHIRDMEEDYPDEDDIR